MESTTESRMPDRDGKNPFYLIGEQAVRVVLGLVEASKNLNQGNVSFQLSQPVRAVFHAKDSSAGWELTVSTGFGNSKRDVYRITDEGLIYQYSEADSE